MVAYGEVVWWSILAGTVIHMAVGAIWYMPQVMGNRWAGLLGKTLDQIQEEGNPGQAMGLMVISALASAWVINWVHGLAAGVDGGGVGQGVWVALLLYFGFSLFHVEAHGFEGRPWGLYPVDQGWKLLAWLLTGVVAGLAV